MGMPFEALSIGALGACSSTKICTPPGLRGGGEASPSLFLGDLIVVFEFVCICVVVLIVKGGECIHKLRKVSFPDLPN